jgi:predicted transport protein
MAKSPEEMMESMISNLPGKTGKSLELWLELAKSSELEKHGEIVKFLKSEHNVTHGYANLIAHKFLASDASSVAQEIDLVKDQYKGDKLALRPIYDKLAKHVLEFGNDVELSPKKAYVSLRRKKQFGIIQPSTKSRIDVGINLKGVSATDRLEKAGSFNAMVSHRVRLSDIDQIEGELLGWLKQAYEIS